MSKAVAVDLDGVLAEYDGWKGPEEIGDPHPGVRSFLEYIRDGLGLEVVVHTTRTNPDPFNDDGRDQGDSEELEGIIWRWLQEHDLQNLVDRVFTGTGKPIAVAYVDDRAVTCRPGPTRDGMLGSPTHEFEAAIMHIRSLMEE